ncbi:MAG: hypothetical protein K0R14_2137 [Burkholderiales bacterium]|jgi:hypothetical protein|nr:hypothetical protein [Burkholderiales bacterium]
MKSLFKIDGSKPIFYRTTESFKVADTGDDMLYQTEIWVPIKSIGDSIKAYQIQILGCIDDWFNPDEINIIDHGIVHKGENLQQQDWQHEKDLEVHFTTLMSIICKDVQPLNKNNYEIKLYDDRLKGLEDKIIESINTEIMPLVSSKKAYEETWQLKISKIDDGKLWRKFFDYKSKKNLTTSKALKELLNFAFLCLKNGFVTDPYDPKSLIRQEPVEASRFRSIRVSENPTGNLNNNIIPENKH